MPIVEVQLDRIVGPLHHFGGLGVGNLASQSHAGHVSHPAAAAIEGLDKMRLVAGLGVPQWILPPQHRPAMRLLHSLGFSGSRRQIIASAYAMAPEIFSAACSSSAMWTANAATVSAAADTSDGRVKLSIANLSSSMHRAIEASETEGELRTILASLGEDDAVDVYTALPRGVAFRDEGAANHMRLSASDNRDGVTRGLNLFVYGDGAPAPTHYLSRQSRLASEAIARRHGLDDKHTFYLKQHPRAIDAGAFHNDVVAMSHEDLLIHHENAFWEAGDTIRRIGRCFEQLTGQPLKRVAVPESILSLDEAISSYLFNSQLLTTNDQKRVLVCPAQVRSHIAAMRLVESWQARDGYFDEIHFVNVQESMAGGGGPACLRLRIPMQDQSIDRSVGRQWWTESIDAKLRDIIQSHYPERLELSDLVQAEIINQAIKATGLIRDLLT